MVPVIDTLLSQAYGQSAAVSVPVAGGGGGFRGRFPAGVDDAISYIRQLATEPSEGEARVNWFFLVGGPGNGKSRAIQELASAIGIALPSASSERPTSRALPEAWPADTYSLASGLELVFVNDASIDRPAVDGLGGLAADIDDALGAITGGRRLMLFANVNRGVLVEERANHFDQAVPTVQDILDFLATSHTKGASASPYYAQKQVLIQGVELCVHALSLDVTSLVEPPPGPEVAITFGAAEVEPQPYATVGELHRPGGNGDRALSPAGQLLAQLVDVANWQHCAGCRASDECPFSANARWLRDRDLLVHFLDVLRAAEVTTGWRLTYRELLAEMANAILGGLEAEWVEGMDPCDWVRAKAATPGLEGAAALVSHRIYAAVFGGPALTPAQHDVLTSGGPLAGLAAWLASLGAGRPPRLNAACIAIRPSRDTSGWGGEAGDDLKHDCIQAVEVMTVEGSEAPSSWIRTRAEVPADAHSELEARLDREIAAFIEEVYVAGEAARPEALPAVLKARLHLLLSQVGLATGRLHKHAEIEQFLRTQQALLMQQEPDADVRAGLQNLLAGSGQVNLLSPRASTTPATSGVSQVSVGVSSVQPRMWAEGDQMMVRLYDGDPGMPISFDLLREMLIAADADAGFTDIPELQLARVERARARLVSRAQAKRLPLQVTLADGRKFRVVAAADQQHLKLMDAGN